MDNFFPQSQQGVRFTETEEETAGMNRTTICYLNHQHSTGGVFLVFGSLKGRYVDGVAAPPIGSGLRVSAQAGGKAETVAVLRSEYP